MAQAFSVETILERLPHSCARWLDGPQADVDALLRLSAVKAMEDRDGRPVALFEGDWSLNYARDKFPTIRFLEMPD